jgi:hypothetical protein
VVTVLSFDQLETARSACVEAGFVGGVVSIWTVRERTWVRPATSVRVIR